MTGLQQPQTAGGQGIGTGLGCGRSGIRFCKNGSKWNIDNITARFRKKGSAPFEGKAVFYGGKKGGRALEDCRKDAVFQGKYLTKRGQTYIYIIVS